MMGGAVYVIALYYCHEYLGGTGQLQPDCYNITVSEMSSHHTVC